MHRIARQKCNDTGPFPSVRICKFLGDFIYDEMNSPLAIQKRKNDFLIRKAGSSPPFPFATHPPRVATPF